ncbi:hypothetical protein EJB05_13322, partial [Eragrostis curvula]
MTWPGLSRLKKPWIAPGDGADHITGLPLELRAHIASFLPFRQVGQLSSLSRPWRRIHDHTPVVHVKLDDFLFLTNEMLDEDEDHPGVLDDDALAGLEDSLLRRRTEGSGSCKVDTLRISYTPDDARMARHADRIIAAADAREICVKVPNSGKVSRVAWAVAVPPSTRDLEVVAFIHLAPAIAGPGAAALRTLLLHHAVIREWPRLPSLRSLTALCVTVLAPFPPAAWYPQLEYLGIFNSAIDLARVDICLPQLKVLEMDEVHVVPPGGAGKPLADVTVDSPVMEKLDMYCSTGCTPDYGLFTARVPRLRHLTWHHQFAERVNVHFGSPSSVGSGSIVFTWNGGFHCRETKECKALMMRMLGGLLPELSSDGLADAARPYMTLDKYKVEDSDTGEMFPEEKLTCNLKALMTSREA